VYRRCHRQSKVYFYRTYFFFKKQLSCISDKYNHSMKNQLIWLKSKFILFYLNFNLKLRFISSIQITIIDIPFILQNKVRNLYYAFYFFSYKLLKIWIQFFHLKGKLKIPFC
jgi:small-conductance mechanosensitive channel